MSLNLSNLSTELLLKIFTFVDLQDLCNLKRTCRRFNQVIKKWDNSILNVTAIVTNQRNEKMLLRSSRLTALEKIRISRNWSEGSYIEKIFLHTKQKYRPHLQLNDDFLYISRGNKIMEYKRNRNSLGKQIGTHPTFVIEGNTTSDVEHFSYKNGLLVSGNCDGSMWLWSREKKTLLCDLPNCHQSDIHGIDISNRGSYAASGSRDNAFKLWKTHPEQGLEEHFHENLNDRVWCVSIQDERDVVAVGTSANTDLDSLFIYDVENLSEPTKFSVPNLHAGILDIKWYDRNTLWTSGYFGTLNLWDLRTGKSEAELDDFHAGVFCSIDTDHFNTILSGAQLHGRITLWDIRKLQGVQMYFLKKSGNNGTTKKIYSIAFDPENVFAATEQCVHVLSFSTYNADKKDYSFAIPGY